MRSRLSAKRIRFDSIALPILGYRAHKNYKEKAIESSRPAVGRNEASGGVHLA